MLDAKGQFLLGTDAQAPIGLPACLGQLVVADGEGRRLFLWRNTTDRAPECKQARGAIKDAAGKVTGDAKLQADGKLDKAEGKVQSKVGEAKEAVRDALKR